MAQHPINNSFHKGLNLDSPDYQTPNSVYTYAQNVTFITHEGNELIMQNEKGTELRANIKENYIPLAVKDYNGVAYIVSAEIINGEFTGRGEIGSYPSPDYQNKTEINCSQEGCDYDCDLINEYQPFQNYGGDDDLPINALVEVNLGEFNSKNFNFDADFPVEIVAIQPVYDDTVNVIFTDWLNKPKLINSRFSVLPNNKVRIINRKGSKDTNIYSEANFKNRLNHILSADRIAFFRFDGQETGGQLPTGSYRYFFKYETADGNTTDIFAESFNIPVFFGDSVASIRGGFKNENTNKLNILRLYNLDPSFSRIRVFYTYTAGEVGGDSGVETYLLQTVFQYIGTEAEIRHTGFENSSLIQNELLLIDNANIFTYRTGTEIKSRLAVANIKTKGIKVALLRDFAQQITINTQTTQMVIPGLDDDQNHSAIYQPITDSFQRQTYQGAYYNSRNVHDYLGYWGGETYLFGVGFLYDDGTNSEVYPVRGIDNRLGNATYTNRQFIDEEFDATNGENVKGMYRFPERQGTGLIYQAENYVNVLSPEFVVPTLTDELIEDGVIGLKFYRSRRKIDCIGQGIIFNTAIFPTQNNIDFREDDPNENGLNKFFGTRDSDDGYRPNNSRFVPAFNYLMEGSGRWGYGDTASTQNRRVPDMINRVKHQGIEIVQTYNGHHASPTELDYFVNRKLAFISPDFICNPVNNQRLYGSTDYSFRVLGDLQMLYSVPSNVPYPERGSTAPWNPNNLLQYPTNRHFSTIKQIALLPTTGESLIKTNNAEYVISRTVSRSSQGFSSSLTTYMKIANFKGFGINFDGEGNANRFKDSLHYTYFDIDFNDYVGIDLETPLNLSTIRETRGMEVSGIRSTAQVRIGDEDYVATSWTSGAGYETDAIDLNDYIFTTSGNRTETNAAKLINLYRQEGLRPFSINNEIYQFGSESFYAITQPYYFFNTPNATINGVQQSLENLNNRVIAFNGDCFINLTHRRLFNTRMSLEDTTLEPGIAATNVGYTLAFVAESNYNVAGRYEEIADLEEGTVANNGRRTFYPFGARTYELATPSNSVKGEDNPWRTNRLIESKKYNTGYDRLEVGKFKTGNAFDTPFIQDRFDTRIWISAPYVVSEFSNGYRTFSPLAFRDYTKKLGQIVAIRNSNEAIISVHEFGTIGVPVQERIAQTGDLAGKVFFESSELLAPPENVRYISEIHGSQWQFSVIATNNAIYGIDMNTTKAWRTNGGAMELISDFNIQSFLRELQPYYTNTKYNWFSKIIRAYYDKRRNDVLFTFIRSGSSEECGTSTVTTPATCAQLTTNNSGLVISGGIPASTREVVNVCYDANNMFNLVYNERQNIWKTFYSWTPINAFTIYDTFYSFPLQSNKLYEHFANENFSVYYDNLEDFVIEINANVNSKIHHIYDNLKIISNEIYPYKIEYTTSLGTRTQTIKPKNVDGLGAEPFKQAPLNQAFIYDFVYKEDHMYGVIKPDDMDKRERMIGEILRPIYEQRIKDKFCKIRIFYKSEKQIILQLIETIIDKSNV